MNIIEVQNQSLILELSQLIEDTQCKVVNYANGSLTLLFWQIGKRINDEILQGERAEYGKQIVSTVSTQLPSKEELELELKLHQTLLDARSRFGMRLLDNE